MTQSLNFQAIIMSLQQFWADQGCLIWQPYYSQVGAGTLNPATALRVLGPEPWNVAYVEPSVRPDDGRYGENPNRLQMHYQLQVILKPDPGNPQELYLKSLEAIGIDPRQHDIRFVEDNWESPALGAWGLGWEVWLDGQEITQYTYFQQAGGKSLDPVSVEITYGLDRIAIGLQRVRGFTEIRWNDRLTAGDVNLQGEQEHSRYYFDLADVDRTRQLYDLHEAEAKACLAQGLVLPAHDHVLRCSHLFNILDARGAIGVTERQAYFGRMRDLSRQIADTYLEQRQRLEFPWLNGEQGIGEKGQGMASQQNSAPSSQPPAPMPLSPAPFLLEIGTEELPVGDLEAAMQQLRERVPVALESLRLEHGEIQVFGTPRRLVVLVQNLASHQPDREQIVKGPPADRAFGPDGAPTKAAEGFARSRGVAVSDLTVQEMDGGRYVAALVREAGRSTEEVLAEALPGLVGGLRFDKPMRWNATNVAFSRPVRWLLAIYGAEGSARVVPFEWGGLRSANTTRGLRFYQPQELSVSGQAEYFAALAQQGILLDPQERRESIRRQVQALAEAVDGRVPTDESLLDEVTHLVEAPTALRGQFEEQYLRLPREVLVSVMKKHQRYFAVEGPDGALLPYFIAVRNGDDAWLDLVIEGNEHVIRARYADANFFIREDIKKPLADFVPLLSTLTFQKKLGSMLDKTHRIVALVEDLAGQVGLDDGERAVARRAAELCKADLATKMVVEMTSLQGLMGRYYAYNSGESQDVAMAIFEHYLPRSAGDSAPRSRPGLIVGLADRLDTLAGLFAAGLAPSGTKDPFAQRRAALGLVQNLIAWDLDFDLGSALQPAASHLPIEATPQSQAAVLDFILERLRNVLLEANYRHDIVDAVLNAQGRDPARAARAVKALSAWVARLDWHTILPAYARCVRITRSLAETYPVRPEALSEPAEVGLWEALQAAEARSRAPGSVDDLFTGFLPMIPAVDRFFEQVLVMVEDPAQRENRLGLLQRIAALSHGVADLSRLDGF